MTFLSPQARLSGNSLVDVMFAIALVSFACSALFLLCSSALQLLQTQSETAAATLCLQERVEQVRVMNWDVVNAPLALNALLADQPASGAQLPGLVEDLTIIAYPTLPSYRSLHMRRAANGTITAISQPTDTSLNTATLVRVDWRATWNGRGRTHIRENTLLLAQGGRVQ